MDAWPRMKQIFTELKMMLSSEFLRIKFSLLIDHPRNLQKFHTAKISGYVRY